MILCTECYLQKEGKTLMMYRNKKENDINKGKWIGVGGKFHDGESPEECLKREVMEETGVSITTYKMRGMLTFNFLDGSSESLYVFIYTATEFTGEIGECDEGELKWIDTDKILDLDLWEGDKLFWKWLLEDNRFFSSKFSYNADNLVDYTVDFY